MLIDDIKNEVETRLPSKRAAHVLRVAETAVKLSRIYSVDEKKAEVAALLHDIAKAMGRDELQSIIEDNEIDPLHLKYPFQLWHAPAGAVIAVKDFGIVDEDILNAIRYHTTGRTGMSDLEKLIYISDLIEPGRNFPGVEPLRDIAGRTLDEVMIACISHTLGHLVETHEVIHPFSLDCYNEYMQK